MRNVWFTADFHFGHLNIIRYCKRPFGNTQEMDDAIAERVNACAKPNDVLYFLGDFCMGREEQVIDYRKRLACKTIHFIEGNHDKATRKQQQLFVSCGVLSEVNVAKQRIVLCHYAMRVWPHHTMRREPGIFMGIRTLTYPMNLFHSRWMLESIRMIFVRGISMKFGL